MMTRQRLLEIIERQFLEMGYGEVIDIDRGHVSIQVQIENGKPTVVIRDREIVKA